MQQVQVTSRQSTETEMVKEHREPSTPRTVAKLGAEITIISASPT